MVQELRSRNSKRMFTTLLYVIGGWWCLQHSSSMSHGAVPPQLRMRLPSACLMTCSARDAHLHEGEQHLQHAVLALAQQAVQRRHLRIPVCVRCLRPERVIVQPRRYNRFWQAGHPQLQDARHLRREMQADNRQAPCVDW